MGKIPKGGGGDEKYTKFFRFFSDASPKLLASYGVSWPVKNRVALFGTGVVALFGTSKNLVAEPSLFGTVRKNILGA